MQLNNLGNMPIIFFIVVVDLIGFGIIIPLLPFYAEHFNADPTTVGMIMATYSLTQFIAAPFWGRLSDRIGRRPVLLFSLAGSAIAYSWLGFADQLWVLFSARALGGFMAGNISAAFAYVADITTPENRARGMGMIGAAFGLGFVIGPAIGGILGGSDPINADYKSPSLAAAGLSTVALIFGILFLKESLSQDIRNRPIARTNRSYMAQLLQSLSSPNLTFLLLMSFLATVVFSGLEVTFAMWSRRQFGWGPEQNGYLFAFVGVIGAIVQGGLVGILARRFGEIGLVIQGALTLCLGVIMIPFAQNITVLVIAMTISAYGFSIISPALNSAISLSADEENQGMVMGATRSTITLARVAGPIIAGVLFSTFGKEWPFYAGAAIMMVVLVLVWRRQPALVSTKVKMDTS